MADTNNTCIRRPLTRYTTCRCDKCTPVVRHIYKQARLGRLPRESSDDAWAQLDQWLEDGFSPTWIASALNLPARGIESALSERSNGHLRTFGPERTRIILSGDIGRGSAGYCSALGARRRLQALAVAGWTTDAMQDDCGIHFVTLAAIQRGATTRIRADGHHTIAAMYDRLAKRQGTSSRTSKSAIRKGWEPVAAWDDPDTDPELEDIDASLDEVKVQRVLAGIRTDCTAAEQAAIIDAWTGSTNQLQRITGWNVARINRKVA